MSDSDKSMFFCRAVLHCWNKRMPPKKTLPSKKSRRGDSQVLSAGASSVPCDVCE